MIAQLTITRLIDFPNQTGDEKVHFTPYHWKKFHLLYSKSCSNYMNLNNHNQHPYEYLHLLAGNFSHLYEKAETN